MMKKFATVATEQQATSTEAGGGSRRQQLHEGAPLITIIDMDDTTQ
jgi:hypothetical protein